MGRGEEREPEPGLVRARGAHRPGRGGGAEGVRGDLQPRRRARRHGDRLPARQDPGRVAVLRAQEARRLLPDHRRQQLPQPARRLDAAETRADQVDGRGEAIPAETVAGFSKKEFSLFCGDAGASTSGSHSQRECVRGADGRGARLLARSDHPRAVRSRRSVPPEHVAQRGGIMPNMMGMIDGMPMWPFGPLMMLVVAALVIVPFWLIFAKAGFSGWLSLLMVVPVANIVMLYVLAFSAWPSLRDKNM